MTRGYRVETSRLGVWVEEAGRADGPPIVMCHRMGAQGFEWEPAFIDALAAAGFRTIAFDWRGFGYSDEGEPERYVFRDMVLDVLALVDALGLSHAHLLGASLGGVIARWALLMRPELFRTLTLISTSTGDDRLAVWSPEFAAVAAQPPGPTENERIDYIVAELRVMCDMRFDEVAARARAAEAVRRGYLRRQLGRQMSASGKRTDEEKAMLLSAPVAQPMFVVHGTDDKVLPLIHGQALKDLYPHAELLVIDGMGHELQPHYIPQICDRLLPFLRSAPLLPRPPVEL